MGCSGSKLIKREESATFDSIVKKEPIIVSNPVIMKPKIFVRGPPGLDKIDEAPNSKESSPSPPENTPNDAVIQTFSTISNLVVY